MTSSSKKQPQPTYSSTATFLERGTCEELSNLESLYSTALQLKANSKKHKSNELVELDAWYQSVLPGIIAGRQDEPFVTHEELGKLMKWKLMHGTFRPRLQQLVSENDPQLVLTESKKALRATNEPMTVALGHLCKLKGIGPASASAVLAAARPDLYAFMADECLEVFVKGQIRYTIKEYEQMMSGLRKACDRLNEASSTTSWTPHRVELILWTHSVLLKLGP